jgi:hypothetical protein
MVSSIAKHEDMPISSFACARIVDASKDDKTIAIQLSTKCPEPPSGGIRPDFGVILLPSFFR